MFSVVWWKLGCLVLWVLYDRLSVIRVFGFRFVWRWFVRFDVWCLISCGGCVTMVVGVGFLV